MNQPDLSEMISYAHQQDPKGQRFRQFRKDPLPAWAVDVQPDNPEDTQAESRARLLEAFKKECNDKGREIDPNDELCWLSLTVGWAIAKGLSPQDANDFATCLTYSNPLDMIQPSTQGGST